MADDIRGPKKKMPGSGGDPEHTLPWPESSDPARLGERFQHGGAPEERALGEEFERATEADQHELGREFADPNFADERQLANAFADPNSMDDARIGKSFTQTQSSAKKPPLKERVHLPHAPKEQHSRKVLKIFLLCFAALFLIVVLAGWLPRHFRDKETQRRADEQRTGKPVVQTARVRREKSNEGLVVPGTTSPLTEAFVYARANGYLKTRLADIGDHVRKGQLLAIIDAPDLDAQVAQAREQLRQAEQQLEQQRAQLALATVTVQRYRVLVAKGVFSRQEGDQQETNYASQQANVSAAQRNVEAFRANLQRVIALQSYEYVRAPFSGVVTQRNVDVGALISAQGAASGTQSSPAPAGQTSSAGGSQQAGQANNAGSSGSTNQSATSQQSAGQGGPLFGIAQIERLRILTSVPEGYATAVHPGSHAKLSFNEYPGADFEGEITRSSNSVDPNTRTMLTEIQVDNRNGKLMPGMYAVATFAPEMGGAGPLVITGDAIAVRHDKTMVAKVVNGKIQMTPITIGRDYGSVVEVLTGVQENDLIVTSLSDEVADGVEVQTREDKASEQQASPPPPSALGGSTQYGNQGTTDRNLQGKQGQQNGRSSGGQQQGNNKPGSSGSKP